MSRLRITPAEGGVKCCVSLPRYGSAEHGRMSGSGAGVKGLVSFHEIHWKAMYVVLD